MGKVKAFHSGFCLANATAIALALGLCAPHVKAQAPQSAATAGAVTFQLVNIQLTGATLLTPAEWGDAAKPFLGKDITFADLESARAAIEARFHASGWRLVSVRIPAQSTSDGVVRMEVLEPKLRRVVLKNTSQATTRNPANARAALPELVEGTTPNLNTLDKQLAIANENGSRRSQVAFTLEASAPGKARDLLGEIQTEEQSSSRWQVFTDNTGSKETGRLRYGVAFRHDDVWGLDHQLNLQLTSAPHDEDNPKNVSLLPSSKVQIFGMGYRLPLPKSLAFVDATLAYSNVDSGNIANFFTVAGQGTTAGLKYTQLLGRVGSWEPRVFVGIDWRHYDSQLMFGGINLAVPIELHPLQLGVSASKLATPQDLLGATVYASLHVNLPGGSNGSQASFTATRLDATAHYKLLRFGSSVNLPIGSWQLSAAVDAQLTRALLVSSEQLAAGGASTVRGFSERGIGGDSGLRMQLEALSPDWLSSRDGQGASLRGVVFVDAASTRRNRPAVFEQSNASIASAGVGLRAVWGPSVWRLDVAKAIHQNTQVPRVWGAVHFSAAVSF
jgi:hemolysin activation/secretion protein